VPNPSWSWSATEGEVLARQQEADGLVGRQIRSVKYFTLDYNRHELHPGLVDSGPRAVRDDNGLGEPMWAYDGFDTLDYGLELIAESGEVFSLTWDPPGEREGIGVQPVPMIGRGVRRDADVAVWDAGSLSAAWRPLVGSKLTRVDLHYLPWDENGQSRWCPRITIGTDRGSVEVIMGDESDGVLVPSADNVAVLHPGIALPAWLQQWYGNPRA
jgi:hypothetical protein